MFCWATHVFVYAHACWYEPACVCLTTNCIPAVIWEVCSAIVWKYLWKWFHVWPCMCLHIYTVEWCTYMLFNGTTACYGRKQRTACMCNMFCDATCRTKLRSVCVKLFGQRHVQECQSICACCWKLSWLAAMHCWRFMPARSSFLTKTYFLLFRSHNNHMQARICGNREKSLAL